MRKHAKIVFKEFGSSFGRFMAIAGIIMLGLAFLIGINGATPDIKASFSSYFEDSALYDIYLYPSEDAETTVNYYDENGDGATLELKFGSMTMERDLPNAPVSVGIKSAFDENDVQAATAIDGVGNAESVIYYDATVTVNGKDKPTRFFGVGDMADLSVNRLTLVDGRLPESANEVVAVRPFANMEPIAVGDTLTVAESDRTLQIDVPEIEMPDIDPAELNPFVANYTIETTVADLEPVTLFNESELTVVGIVTSPMYYSANDESCTIGDGSIDYILFTRQDLFGNIPAEISLSYIGDIDTEKETITINITPEIVEEKSVAMISTLWLTAVDSAKYTAFTDEYETFSKALEKRISGSEAATEGGWTVLRRSTNLSYYGLNLNADKVTAIAGIFPVFFIAVAALVAFSTIFRMVGEDRGQIGTLRSLGYRGSQIVGKYIFYSVAACVLGILVGVPLGITILPIVIFNAYGALYTMPAFVLIADWPMIVLSCVVALAATVLVTVLACVSTLRETPAQIMQPKAPKAGKRILLERGPLWKILPFKWKATFRNIFRHKRNLIMTVLAVAGCSALILAGFGMMNSTAEVTELQFNRIYQYDLTLGVTSDYTQDADVMSFLEPEGKEPLSYLEIRKERGNLTVGEQTDTVNIVVGETEDGRNLNDYIDLGEEFTNDSVMLSKGIADEFGVRAGDKVKLENANGDVRELTVTKVVTMYSESWIFIGKDSYNDAYGEGAAGFNSLLVKSGVAEEDQSGVAEMLYGSSAVTGVTFTSSEKATFDNLSETLYLIVVVLIVCAGALVIIVLYNLTNINIGERKKEIATLKVLGYRKREVAGYVFREIFILVLLGIAVGIGVGWGLLAFILGAIQNPFMLFPSVVYWWSYLASVGLTIVFSGLVDLLLLPKLNRIDMADSMKAVD